MSGGFLESTRVKCVFIKERLLTPMWCGSKHENFINATRLVKLSPPTENLI